MKISLVVRVGLILNNTNSSKVEVGISETLKVIIVLLVAAVRNSIRVNSSSHLT